MEVDLPYCELNIEQIQVAIADRLSYLGNALFHGSHRILVSRRIHDIKYIQGSIIQAFSG